MVAKWLSALEKKLEESAEDAHNKYRVFISAEPAPTPDMHIIPQGEYRVSKIKFIIRKIEKQNVASTGCS